MSYTGRVTEALDYLMLTPRSSTLQAKCNLCEASIEVSPEVLQVNAGLITCETCGAEFNAAWNLIDRIPNPILGSTIPVKISTFSSLDHEKPLTTPTDDRSASNPADGYEAGGSFYSSGRTEPRLQIWVDDDSQAPDKDPSVNPRPPEPTEEKSTTRSIWPLAGIFIAVFGLFFQVRFVLLEEIASAPQMRPFIAALCRQTGCELAPPLNKPAISVTHSSIDLHRTAPEALIVRVHLLNHSHNSENYPSLEISLNSASGELLGRRTYLPREYGVASGAVVIGSGREAVVRLVLANVDPRVRGLSARAVRS
ncbi:MAG: DUF3426 domain-containing protein [Proteobacteria bacterium]|nr:DUF3426 domain-containing protein [Pseudomonadota bacterium]MBT5625370.1 DUF3426 domain-containing protein [Pseudomonadota bacterium]MBT6071779.1 DUF3426 domain-containing protein [Pseudomonadota bacterium]MBT6932621.1 DUF3426 domain-containing protein [Pseudomonadota bacterium]MBT7109820.1 DUF3426 domain-containing protein [Pseudomonadota bacterium]